MGILESGQKKFKYFNVGYFARLVDDEEAPLNHEDLNKQKWVSFIKKDNPFLNLPVLSAGEEIEI